ncbi:copper resistance CopC family protein [Nonomuraea sp. NPDC046802]|uniref:copper resistance CopC family protein n=1 Tax=Nonomuraea sp. NPDC046802 TaxID=3154919 RepID=UPI0033C46429
MRRLLTVLLLACAAAGIAPAPAQAHNVLVDSDPKDGATLGASPERVTLVFDQAVRQGYAQVGVTGADGSSWADGSAAVAAERVSVKVKPLRDSGTYTVGYRILSADGHPVTGKITFTLSADATSPNGTTATEDARPDTGKDTAEAAESTPGTGEPGTGESTAGAGENAAAWGQGSSADAAEAAANGGAGMAVVWIVGALLVLAAGTAVALRRSTPAPAAALATGGPSAPAVTSSPPASSASPPSEPPATSASGQGDGPVPGQTRSADTGETRA